MFILFVNILRSSLGGVTSYPPAYCATELMSNPKKTVPLQRAFRGHYGQVVYTATDSGHQDQRSHLHGGRDQGGGGCEPLQKVPQKVGLSYVVRINIMLCVGTRNSQGGLFNRLVWGGGACSCELCHKTSGKEMSSTSWEGGLLTTWKSGRQRVSFPYYPISRFVGIGGTDGAMTDVAGWWQERRMADGGMLLRGCMVIVWVRKWSHPSPSSLPQRWGREGGERGRGESVHTFLVARISSDEDVVE